MDCTINGLGLTEEDKIIFLVFGLNALNGVIDKGGRFRNLFGVGVFDDTFLTLVLKGSKDGQGNATPENYGIISVDSHEKDKESREDGMEAEKA